MRSVTLDYANMLAPNLGGRGFDPDDLEVTISGTVTPGNSCPLTDGAAAVVLTSADDAESFDIEPLGYIKGYAFAGCDPGRMGLGPVFASALARTTPPTSGETTTRKFPFPSL